jgi:glycosyltransferase involved in cell wall biosynthesis
VIAEAAAVLVSSQACRDEAYKLGIYPHHVHKVLPGVDLQRFRPGEPEGRLAATLRGDGDGGPVLLSLIGESPGKDLETLLRAFQIVRGQRSGARLALVGRGLRKRCAPLLAESDARGAVTFLEGVRDGELPDLYRSADVYVLAEQDEQKRRVPEGLEMSCVEALASGLPVACTRTRVLEELVTEGEAGLVVEAGAHAKLGRAVLDIVGTARGRADFARRARERAEAELDAAAASRQVRTFLEVTYYRRLRLAPLETVGPESPGDPSAERD